MESTVIRLAVPAGVDPRAVTGAADAHLRALERVCAASVSLRDGALTIRGPASEVELACRVLTRLMKALEAGEQVCAEDVERWTGDGRGGAAVGVGAPAGPVLVHHGRAIRAKTAGQQRYLDAIASHTITFCAGPAGTGKTYLAMAMAIRALSTQAVRRIVLTRPVVEAGENLGFLPGTLEEKIDPYMRPLYDALFDMTEREHTQALIEDGLVEIAPLAYMRGRTLNDAFVILDEAQNTTPGQMKMFLTRLGFNATFVVTGDTTQRDLPGGASGLSDAEHTLAGIPDIAFVHLDRRDVVRHRLVGKIVEAYEAAGKGGA